MLLVSCYDRAFYNKISHLAKQQMVEKISLLSLLVINTQNWLKIISHY